MPNIKLMPFGDKRIKIVCAQIGDILNSRKEFKTAQPDIKKPAALDTSIILCKTQAQQGASFLPTHHQGQ